MSQNISIYSNLSSMYFFEFCFTYFPNYAINTTSRLSSEEGARMLSDCASLIEVIQFCTIWFDRTRSLILSVGFLLNLVVLAVLFASSPKSASDVYLMSILVGDLLICLSTLVSSHLSQELGGVVTSVLAEIFGNLGKTRMTLICHYVSGHGHESFSEISFN